MKVEAKLSKAATLQAMLDVLAQAQDDARLLERVWLWVGAYGTRSPIDGVLA